MEIPVSPMKVAVHRRSLRLRSEFNNGQLTLNVHPTRQNKSKTTTTTKTNKQKSTKKSKAHAAPISLNLLYNSPQAGGDLYCPQVEAFVCLLVACLFAWRPSNRLVYLRDGSAQTILYAATLRWKLQIKLSTSPSHSILTPGWPAPALTL